MSEQLLLPGSVTKLQSVPLAAVITHAGLATSNPFAQQFIDNRDVSIRLGDKWITAESGKRMFDLPIGQPFYIRVGKRIKKVVVVK